MEIKEGKKLMREEERRVGKKCGRRDKKRRQEREGMGVGEIKLWLSLLMSKKLQNAPGADKLLFEVNSVQLLLLFNAILAKHGNIPLITLHVQVQIFH